MSNVVRQIQIHGGAVALVDERDYAGVVGYRWYELKRSHTSYAVRNVKVGGKRTTRRMHRELMGNPPFFVDHRNHDGLDNRRENLRVCTNRQNAMNSRKRVGARSAFKGATWDKSNRTWISRIKIDGRDVYLGRFLNDIDAARAYDAAALDMFGEYACTNQMLGLIAAEIGGKADGETISVTPTKRSEG